MCFSLNFFHDSSLTAKEEFASHFTPLYFSWLEYRFRVVLDKGWANYTRGERKHEARRTDLASCADISVSNQSGLKAHGLMGISVTFERENS